MPMLVQFCNYAAPNITQLGPIGLLIIIFCRHLLYRVDTMYRSIGSPCLSILGGTFYHFICVLKVGPHLYVTTEFKLQSSNPRQPRKMSKFYLKISKNNPVSSSSNKKIIHKHVTVVHTQLENNVL